MGLTDQFHHADYPHGTRVIPWGKPTEAGGEAARLAFILWGEPAKLLIRINYSLLVRSVNPTIDMGKNTDAFFR